MARDFHILSDVPSRDGARHLLRLISNSYSDMPAFLRITKS